MVVADDLGKCYVVPPDLRDLNYEKFFEVGEEKISSAIDYTSENAERLDLDGMKLLLEGLPYIQDYIKNRSQITCL